MGVQNVITTEAKKVGQPWNQTEASSFSTSKILHSVEEIDYEMEAYILRIMNARDQALDRKLLTTRLLFFYFVTNIF
uniref:Uncharacterized protein n=1 Tax=Kalanchoe fedtschenkoi TaxID=63787 RepID=A0A7N0TLJ5_KALFE